ncbi:hypothetical protein BDZ91DRAFT_734036 [Kalaharituber pfeilii]|nr:hypothetical protein BDZ91DRAFT_734036 [Kalaharituber pfeilii]
MSFSSAIVFPGGNLDDSQDHFLSPYPPAIPPPESLGNTLDLPPDLLTSLKTCAIRETFEETGVLLADPSSFTDAKSVAPPPLPTRDTLTPGTTFQQFLTAHNLTLPTASLHPFTCWITPLTFKRRYRTTMFLAFLPPHISTHACIPSPASTGDEILQAQWIHPRDILSAYYAHSLCKQSKSTLPSASAKQEPKLILFPPQLYLLTILSQCLTLPFPRKVLLRMADETLFGQYVIQPYVKKMVVVGEEQRKATVLGVDRPRGDAERWLLVENGKEGPERVEVMEREALNGVLEQVEKAKL